MGLESGFVSVFEEPLEDLMAEEGELAAAGSTMGRDDAVSGVGANDLLVRA
jgi:hypothetical protein